MNGNELIAALKKKLKLDTDRSLAKKLGLSEVNLSWWKRNGKPVTPAKVANMIASAIRAEVRQIQLNTIKPIVEFFPLDTVESRGGAKYELFPAVGDSDPLRKGLRDQLKASNGIYVFYDSRGSAIYVGKAKRQFLWGEMKSAFNRARDTQSVYRVRHPVRAQEFASASEKPRQPRKTQLKLSDMAAYFSAYEVHQGMIDDLEALLVRGFANDVLNVRMERFEGSRVERQKKKVKE